MNKLLEKLKMSLNLEKPTAETWKGWKLWHEKTKNERPIAYFLAETVPEKFDDCIRFFTRPVNDLRYAIRVRFFDKYHVIPTGLKPGYTDGDIRMLHGMFTLLVDFVEVEKAWMQVVWDRNEQEKRNHPWWSRGWSRFKAFRDPQAGLDYLTWEMSLDSPSLDENSRCESQARAAREIWELYHWWKFVRPTRQDPHDESGWTAHCDLLRERGRDLLDLDDRTPEEREQSRIALDKARQIEERNDAEDEQMLIRLIKNRKNLWT